MTARALMFQGTGSDVGKSLIVAGLCRAARKRGLSVAPFKPQNMSNNAAACASGGEIGRAQALQARAAGLAPHTDFNPVLLKPESDAVAQVVVHGRAVGRQSAKDYFGERASLLPAVLESFGRLQSQYDLVLVEGAGSASEINLRARDIANWGFARAADVPVCLVGDIDRGGVIASLIGTRTVIDPGDAALVVGYIINRFRGEQSLFEEGLTAVTRATGWRSFGVVPWLAAAARLPAEDAVAMERPSPGTSSGRYKIAAPMLPRIANFDDADPLRHEAGVDFTFVPPGRPIPRESDAILLLGTKSTLADLAFLRDQGWHHDIIAHIRAGGRVLGLCGGFQMLGRFIHDTEGIDGPPGSVAGLGLLDVETVMISEKTVRPVEGRCAVGGVPVNGYEIHTGRTSGPGLAAPMFELDGKPEGARNRTGRIEGTYLHGLFSSDAYRRGWLARAGAAPEPAYRHDEAIEQALDDIAEALEAALDVDALLGAARVPIVR